MAPLIITLADELPTDQFDSSIGSLFTVIVVLALIVGLIILVLRFIAKKNRTWFQAKSIRNLGGIGVGQNKSVQLVKIGSSIYVVGVGEDVRLLDKIEDEVEIDLILQSLNGPSTFDGRGMFTTFQSWLANRSKTTVSRDDSISSEAESFQELFHSKMQQIGNKRSKLKDYLSEDERTDGSNR